jgi:ribosome maturation factor RimP
MDSQPPHDPIPEAASAPSEGIRAAIQKVAEPVVAAHRCELVSFEWRRETPGWVLRLYAERLGHDPRNRIGGITLEECAKISRDLGTALDVGELIQHAYHLEVSSPGLERPLGKPEDWTRFVGLRAKVQLSQAIDLQSNRRAYRGEIVGLVDAADGKRVQLRDDDLGAVELPFDRIARANLLIESHKPQPKPGKGPGKHKKHPQSPSQSHNASGEKSGR